MFNIFSYIVRPFIGTGIGRIKPISTVSNYIASLLLRGDGIVDFGTFKMQTRINGRVDYMSIALSSKKYEPIVTKIFRLSLKEGDCVVDVGSNIGYFSLLAGSIVGKSGCVLSYEPNPINMGVLKHNIEINNFSRVMPIQKAVGNFVGSTEFYISNNSWGGSLTKINQEGIIKVFVDKLDNLKISRQIKLLKVDTDGNDLEVLKGAERLIKSGKVSAFIVEVYAEGILASGSSIGEFWSYINSLGMGSKWVIDGDKITSCESISQLMTKKQSVNLFCER